MSEYIGEYDGFTYDENGNPVPFIFKTATHDTGTQLDAYRYANGESDV